MKSEKKKKELSKRKAMSLKYSIITVCLNSEKTIRQTIESVISQSYDNWEHIIVDGASNDSTVEIIKEYNSKYPEKIKYISEKDKGIYDAMNKGIKMATGDLIGILNSDDYYDSFAIESINDTVTTTKRTVYYGEEKYYENEKEVYCSILHHQFLDKYMIWHEAAFVSKDIYEDFGLYNVEYKSAADYEYFLKLFLSKDVTFVPVYKLIVNFRGGGMSSSYHSLMEEFEIKRKYNLISTKEYFSKKLFNQLKYKAGKIK